MMPSVVPFKKQLVTSLKNNIWREGNETKIIF